MELMPIVPTPESSRKTPERSAFGNLSKTTRYPLLRAICSTLTGARRAPPSARTCWASFSTCALDLVNLLSFQPTAPPSPRIPRGHLGLAADQMALVEVPQVHS